MSDVSEKITRIVNEVMGIDISAFDSKTHFSAISNWDSFNNLMLISRLQESFNVEFTALEIENTKQVEDLFILIDKKINKSAG